MDTTQHSCREFIDLLAGSAPTPGGGGASALVGAVGVALGHMVGALTTGKKKYADVEEDIRALMTRAESLQEALLDLVTKDAEVFAPLAAAYGLPAETAAQRVEKARVMEACLNDACAVPLAIMERCGEAIEVAAAFAEKGSRLALSDAGVSVCFAEAALRGASLNIFINTAAMQDRERATSLEETANSLLGRYSPLATEVFAEVQRALRR